MSERNASLFDVFRSKCWQLVFLKTFSHEIQLKWLISSLQSWHNYLYAESHSVNTVLYRIIEIATMLEPTKNT